jgi:hypothetical protein
LGFRDISRFSIPIISGKKQDKNPDFIPLELFRNFEQNRPSPIDSLSGLRSENDLRKKGVFRSG